MSRAEAPIGVFDSGVGGLTVTREIMRQIPKERIVYFGDTARVPYGSKSRETIIKYSRQITRFLIARNVKAIVVACNTASAVALEEIQKEMDIPMLGVIKPGAKVAGEATRNGKIGIIATETTINSQVYTKIIKEKNPRLSVIGKACPLLVPLVEEGTFLKDPITEVILSRYLEGLKKEQVDTLVLGCTHYPLIRSTVGRIMGEGVTLVNPAYETALELKRLLAGENLESQGRDELKAGHRFFVSDAPEKFRQFAKAILPCPVEEATKINIEEY